MRTMTLGVLRRIIELAGDVGAEAVVIGPGKANPLLPMPRNKLKDLFFRALDELVPLAAAAGTAIYIENMPFAFLPGAQELLDALDEYGNDRIGVVYDVANGHFVKEDISRALRACAPRLRAIHLSDTDQNVYRHAAIGLGTVNFRPVSAVMAEIEFKRRPILEIITAEPDEAIERSARQLFEMGFRKSSA
jgi:sugar phosphate isomerase/epimerase